MSNLFNNSWEAGGLGCGLTPLLDAGAWDDYGGAGICTDGPSGGPAAAIVDDVAADGDHALKVVQMPGNVNGTDFRIIKSFALQTGTVYARWYIRFGDNWHFGNGDHKMMITGPDDSTQNLYWNLRETLGSGGASARLTAYNNEQGTVWCDNRPAMALEKNTWYLIDVRMVVGVHGSLAARINNVACVFTHDAGTPRNIADHSVSAAGIGYIKMDSTYNDGGSISEPMDQYWDAVAVGNIDWIGGDAGSPGGGGGGSPVGGSPGGGGEESPGAGGGGGGTTGIAASIYSDLDLQDPATYYGGFKEARIERWGIAERTLSDPWTGAWQGATFEYEASDVDRVQRIALNVTPARFRRTRCVRMTNRPNRAALGTPYVVWIGPCIDAQPSGRLSMRYTLADRVASAVVTDNHQIPWRLIRDGFLDQLDEIAPSLDLDQPEPIIYGRHTRVPDVSAPEGFGFELTPPLLGKRTILGTQYYVWLIAGQAVADVPRIRVETFTGSPPGETSEMIETPEGSEWLIPHHANHTAIIGASYEDLISMTFDVPRRYTLLYGVVGDGTTTPDLCAKGDRALTVAVEGTEPNGDGTGAVILDRFAQYKHFTINYIANRAEESYMAGAWLANPTFNDPFDGPRTIVDEDAFDACSAIALERFPGDGYQGAAVIGARAGDRRGAPDYLAQWNRSCGCRFGTTHVGALRVVLLHPTEAIKAAAPLYTDATEIALDSFSCSFAWNDLANLIPFRADYEHISGQYKTNGVYPHDASIAAYGVAIPSALREYPFAPGITPSTHLAILEARVRASLPRLVALETTVGPDEVGDSLGYADLGDYIRYRHFGSVSDTIGEIRLAQIVAHQVQVSPRRVRVAAMDCEDLIGFDAPDPGSGGSP